MSNIRLLYNNLLEAQSALFLNGPAVTVALNSWVNGSTTVTRVSAGSNITDGVKRWSLLSGALAAFFPANTRISSVAAATLTMSVAANAAFTSNQSGTFTPNNALVEDSAYPMVNLFGAQRYTPWDPGAGPSYPATIVLEFDLGGTRPTTTFALLGIRWGANGGPSAARLYSGTTMTPAAWTLRQSLAPSFSYVDAGIVGSSTSARYWRVELDFDARCTLAGLFTGVVDQDFGFAVGPGTAYRRIQPVSTQRTPGGIPIFNALGDYERRRWSFRYDALTTATRQKIEAAYANIGITGASRRIPILIDDADLFWEADFIDRELGWTARFTGVDSVNFELESLP